MGITRGWHRLKIVPLGSISYAHEYDLDYYSDTSYKWTNDHVFKHQDDKPIIHSLDLFKKELIDLVSYIIMLDLSTK